MTAKKKTSIILLILVLMTLCLFTSCKAQAETFSVVFKVDEEIFLTKQVKAGEGLVPPTIPTKEGHIGSWDIKFFGEITQNMVVNAVYTPRNYTILFKAEDENGRFRVVDTRTVVYSQSLVAIPAVPTKHGYSGQWDTTDFSSIKSNKEIVAIYTKNSYTLSFVSNGGTEVDAIQALYLTPWNVDISRDGYEFMGWYTDENFATLFSKSTIPSKDTTLYAKWGKIQFTINIDTQMLEYDTKYEKAYGSVIESLTTYARNGYKFNGWFTDSAFTEKAVFPYTVKGNATIYADWVADNRNVASDYTYFMFNTQTKMISANVTKTLPLDLVIPSIYNETIVEGVENEGFKDANIISVVIPESILYVGDLAFATSTLEDVTFNSGSRIKTIGNGAFLGSALTNVMIPKQIKFIENRAFYNAINLEEISFQNESNLEYIGGEAFENTLWYNNLKTNSTSDVQYIGRVLYSAFNQLSEDYILNEATISISPQAFQNQTNLTTFDIPDSIKYIGGAYNDNDMDIKGAFYGCTELIHLNFNSSSNIEEIGKGALNGCNKLINTAMSSDIAFAELFGKENFENSYIINYDGEDFYIPESLVDVLVLSITDTIMPYAFSDAISITNVSVTDGIKTIGERAFNNCIALTNINIPASVEKIGNFAFNDSLEIVELSFSINNSLKYIGESAFNNLEKANFRMSRLEKVEYIGENAFKNCKLLTTFTSNVIKNIGEGAFAGCISIEHIDIPSSVTNAHMFFNETEEETEGFYIIYGCAIPDKLESISIKMVENNKVVEDFFVAEFQSLKVIDIPEGIESIGKMSFAGTSVSSIILPNSLKTLKEQAFTNNKLLTNLTISKGSHLKVIPESAFTDCLILENVYISINITTIDLTAFDGCLGLKNIIVDNDNENYYHDAGVLYKDKTLLLYPQGRTQSLYEIKVGTEIVGESAFNKSKLKFIEFPQTIKYAYENSFNDCEFTKVTAYADSSIRNIFYTIVIEELYIKGEDIIDEFLHYESLEDAGIAINKVTLSDEVVNIGESAFSYSTIKEITIAASVNSIGAGAFLFCEDLETITFENEYSITNIGEYAFWQTKWFENLTPNEIVYIGGILFVYNGNAPEDTEIIIREGTKEVAQKAFESQENIISVTFPSSLEKIGNSAFEGATAITELTFNSGLLTINENAFYGLTNLVSVSFNSEIEYIGKNTFYGAIALNDFELPENLIYIGEKAFYNNSSLTELNIPATVEYIGDFAFYGASLLANIIFEDILILKDMGINVFANTLWYENQSNGIVYVDTGNTTIYDYKGTMTSGYSIVFATTVTTILPYAFYQMSNLQTIRLNDNITYIGKYAFSECSSLSSMTITKDSNISYIGKNAFSDCGMLEEFTIPSLLESFDNSIFENCTNLKRFLILDEEEYDYFRFANNVLYNADYTEIIYVPKGIVGTVTLENTLTTIPENAFADIKDITSILIPDSLQSIGKNAFKNCSSLETVGFGDHSMLTTIGEGAFSGCNIETISIPRRVENIEQSAFDYSENLTIIFVGDTPPIIDVDYDINCTIFVPRVFLILYTDAYEFTNINPSRVLVEFMSNQNVILSVEIGYGEKFENIPEIPSIRGYSGQWAESQLSLIQDTDNGEFYSLTQSISINAAYIKNTYNIKFNYGETETEENYLYQDDLSQLPNISRNTDAQFVYWSEDLETAERFIETSMPDRDIVLYAILYHFELVLDEDFDTYTISPASENVVVPENIIIPALYNEKVIIKIADFAFNDNKDLQKVTISSELKFIGESAFHNSSLAEFIIPQDSNLDKIGMSAFKNTNITEITLPDNLSLIGDYAFSDSELTSIDITIDFSNIGDYVFASNENLKTATINSPNGDNILVAPVGLFINCVELESAYLPENLTIIGQDTFRDCSKLESIVLENIKNIGKSAFEGATSLKRISLTNVNDIGEGAFSGCSSLQNVYFDNNNSINSIGERAFMVCTSLAYFVVPAKTKVINAGAFYGCVNLEYLVIQENNNDDDGSMHLEIMQDSIPESTTIYVSVYVVANQERWENNTVMLYRGIINDFVIDETPALSLLLYIGKNKNVITPSYVDNIRITSISSDVFVGTPYVETITINNENIFNMILDGEAFRYCYNLNQIISPFSTNGVLYNENDTAIIAYPVSKDNVTFEIKNSITSIANFAFYGATKLNAITLKSLTPPTIDEMTFYSMNTNLKIYVPANALNTYKIANIWSNFSDIIYPEYVSYNDYVLVNHAEGFEISQYLGNNQSVNIPLSVNGKSVIAIGDYAFYNSSLTNISIPTNIKYIGNYAFAESKNLTSINMSANVTTLGKNAFENCILLESGVFAEWTLLNKIEENTFKGCESLLTINIPNNLLSIGEGAFEDCTMLSKVVIGNSSNLKSIGDRAFYNCSSLDSINLRIANKLVSIGKQSFANASSLVSITIPESLTIINSYAFAYCENFKNLNFIGESKLAQIGDYAFLESVHIDRLTIPQSVVTIGDYAFYQSNMSKLTFSTGSKINEIGKYAFSELPNIIDIRIYGNLASIKEGAFLNCSQLRWLILDAETPPTIQSNAWDSHLKLYVQQASMVLYKSVWSQFQDGINSINSIYGDYSVVGYNYGTTIGYEIFQYVGSEGDIEIPQKINERTVLSIGSYAFGREATQITIPNTVISLKSSAFYNSYMSTISISSSVRFVENNPFVACENLENIVVDKDNAYYKSINKVLYNKSGTKLLSYPNALADNGYIYQIENSVLEIGTNAFNGAKNVLRIDIPSSIQTIGDNAFSDATSLIAINFEDPTTLESVGTNAFIGTDWYLSQENGVVYLDSTNPLNIAMVVYGYKGDMEIESYIILDDNTTAILPNAFKNQINIKKIYIPASVNYIGENILSGCENITEMTTNGDFILGHLFGKINYQDSYSVYNMINGHTYYVPKKLTMVTISDDSTQITDYMFNNVYFLKKIVIPNSVKSIGRYAFYSQSSNMALSDLNFVSEDNSELETIGSYAFKNCKEITKISLPISLLRINSYAFEGLSVLTSVTFEDINSGEHSALKYIGKSAFADASYLKKIDIPIYVTYIGSKAFYNCVRLATLTFVKMGALVEIGASAFENCKILAEVTTPWKLSVIGDYAFYKCVALNIFNYDRSLESLSYLGHKVFDETPFYNGSSGVTGIIEKTENLNQIIYFGKIAYKYNGNLSSGTVIKLRPSTVSISPYLFDGQKSLFYVTTVPPVDFQGTVLVLNIGLKKIGKYAFANNPNLLSVVLPNGLIEIGDNAFSNCKNLESIDFENANTLEYIGNEAFYNTKWYDNLYGATTYNSIIYIGKVAYKFKGAFAEYQEVTLREDTVSISPYAFDNQSEMVSIHLPQYIKSVGQFAFGNFLGDDFESNLHTVFMGDNTNNANNLAGVLTYASKVILNIAPEPLKGDCAYTYQEIDEEENVVEVSENISIHDLLVLYRELNILPKIYVSREFLQDYCMTDGWSDISDFIMPYDKIKDDFVLALTDTGYEIVYYKGLDADVVVPNEVDQISVTGIREFAFNTSIQNIYIPENVATIYDYAFAKSISLQHIFFEGNGLTNVGNSAFRMCSSLLEINLPSSVHTIGDYAFYNCYNLQNIVMNSGIEYIGEFAFANNFSLLEIKIPDTIKYMGDYLFNNCPNLINLTMWSIEPPTLGANGLYYDSNLKVYVDNSALNTYKNHNDWGRYQTRTFENIKTTPDFLFAIVANGYEIIKYLGSETNVLIPSQYNSIDIVGIREEAFKNCSSLEKIIIPSNVKFIGDYAFYDCNNLTIITMLGVDPPKLGGNGLFDRVNLKIVVEEIALEDYKRHEDWERYEDIIFIED